MPRRRILCPLFVLFFVLAASVGGQTIPDRLTLAGAVDVALAHHGDIEAARQSVMARQGAERQAGLSPNPTVYFQTENWRFTGSPSFSAGQDLDLFAWVSQPIETGGKKRRRGEYAQADRALAEIGGKAVAWRIRQGVKRAYWQVLAAERNVELLAKRRDTLGELSRYHEVRVNLGAMAEVDLIKVRLEVEKIAMSLAVAEMETERTKVALLREMGSPAVSTAFAVEDVRLPKPAEGWESDAVLDRLASDAISHRVEVLLGEALVERARARVELQRAVSRPNVTPYFGYKRNNGFNTLIGGVSLPVPVFNRNQGSIEEASAEVLQAEAALRATKARVRAEVAAAAKVAQRRARMLTRIETGMIDRAQETSRIALAAYQEGATDLLNVIDAQRTENQVGLLYSQVLADFTVSWVDLETAVGTEQLPVEEGFQPQKYKQRAAARMED